MIKDFLKRASTDFPASIVVFLVALPLCIGIAVASDAFAVSGLIAGMVGGIVVGMLSKSPLSVSGPAAGLAAIVAAGIAKLPSYEAFLLAVVLSGLIQILLGYAKAGTLGDFIPNAVIKGMLAAIGIILILKQFPHFLGYDLDPEGDESFFQNDGENTISSIVSAFSNFVPGAIVVGAISMTILLIFELNVIKKIRIFKFLPGPLFVVIFGILLNYVFKSFYEYLYITKTHLVQLEIFDSPITFFQTLPSPDFSFIADKQVWIVALTIAIIASLETLLNIEAIDKIDPLKRISPPNRELKAQGVGNLVSGLLGGLPITSVIVRSSANVSSGGNSSLSTVVHGIWLLLAVLFIPKVLNMIPLAALAAILIFTGYKLARITIFKEQFQKGWDQFIPFIVTVIAIVFTDLLTGILIGFVTGIYFVLKNNFHYSVFTIQDEQRHLLRFRKEVNFLNKSHIKDILAKIPNNTALLIDATHSKFIDNDIVDLVNDFIINASTRDIRVYIKYSADESKHFFNDIENRKIF